MAYPPRYDRSYDFVGFQGANPSQPLPAGVVAAELDAVAASVNAARSFLMAALTASGGVPGAVPPTIPITGYSQGLLELADEAAWRTGLGFGSFFQSLRAAADQAAFRTLIAAAADADVGLVQVSAALANQLVNADMRVNARSSGALTAASGYAADNWHHFSVGGSRSVSRVALSDSDRAALGREDAVWALQHVCTGGGGASDLEIVGLPMEGVRRLAGRRVGVAFWARRTAGAGNIAAELVQSFGNGGSPSAQVTGIGSTKFTLTTSWQRFTFFADIPSAAGKTLGTAANDCLALFFWLSGGSSLNARNGSLGVQTGTFQIADPVVRVVPAGTSPTLPAFEPKPFQLEREMCERFVETSYRDGVAPGAFTLDGRDSVAVSHPTGLMRTTVSFRTRKRTVPTVSVYDNAGAVSKVSAFVSGAWAANQSVAISPADTAGEGQFALGHAIADSAVTQFGWLAVADLLS